MILYRRLHVVLAILWSLLTWPRDFLRDFYGVEQLGGRMFEYSEGWGGVCPNCREEHGSAEACPFGGIA